MTTTPTCAPKHSYDYSLSWIAVNGDGIVDSELQNEITNPNTNPSFNHFRNLFNQLCSENDERQLESLFQYLELNVNAIALASRLFDYTSGEVDHYQPTHWTIDYVGPPYPDSNDGNWSFSLCPPPSSPSSQQFIRCACLCRNSYLKLNITVSSLIQGRALPFFLHYYHVFCPVNSPFTKKKTIGEFDDLLLLLSLQYTKSNL